MKNMSLRPALVFAGLSVAVAGCAGNAGDPAAGVDQPNEAELQASVKTLAGTYKGDGDLMKLVLTETSIGAKYQFAGEMKRRGYVDRFTGSYSLLRGKLSFRAKATSPAATAELGDMQYRLEGTTLTLTRGDAVYRLTKVGPSTLPNLVFGRYKGTDPEQSTGNCTLYLVPGDDRNRVDVTLSFFERGYGNLVQAMLPGQVDEDEISVRQASLAGSSRVSIALNAKHVPTHFEQTATKIVWFIPQTETKRCEDLVRESDE